MRCLYPHALFVILYLLIFIGCTEDSDPSAVDRSGSYASSSIDGGGGGGSDGGGQGGGEAGLITAGEWNDLENWSFWQDLMHKEFGDSKDLWGFYPSSRVSVKVVDNGGQPQGDVKVELLVNGVVQWTVRSDNKGQAELWANLFQKNTPLSFNTYSLRLNNEVVNDNVNLFENGVNEITMVSSSPASQQVEIAFVVDATGSMGDELEFLKEDLQDVVTKVSNDNNNLAIYTSTVFYRDVEDEYIVKHSPFTANITSTMNFIQQQRAEGGGDFPEAVHSALSETVNELQWSAQARTRIAFLLLDAPPHTDPQVISDLKVSVKSAAAKGIKIIPITASGIDKQTEFLMRFIALSTNSTYVFITNDSGIGNDHLDPTVGEYEVEYLNELMIRLIKEYSTVGF